MLGCSNEWELQIVTQLLCFAQNEIFGAHERTSIDPPSS